MIEHRVNAMAASACLETRARKTRVLVVDDHPMVREGLLRLISQQSDLECCGEAGTVAETQTAVSKLKPDLVILDLRLKSGDGLELIKALKAQEPGVRILVLSQYDASLYAERAFRAGALGYVVKEQGAEEVLSAIRTVMAGEVYVTQGMAAVLLHKLVRSAPRASGTGIESLTDRELHVLELLGAGLSTRKIAAELNISFKTIETHRENIKRKLNLPGATELLHFAAQWGRTQASLRPEVLRDSQAGPKTSAA
jgi:DNA-binding NarL/FixJ family response regulator